MDPELTTWYEAFAEGKIHGGSPAFSSDSNGLNWIGLLGEQRTLSASTSLLLAEWLLDVLDDVGVREAARF